LAPRRSFLSFISFAGYEAEHRGGLRLKRPYKARIPN
jgi:hypothetical protein